jgi:hypothetical protein
MPILGDQNFCLVSAVGPEKSKRQSSPWNPFKWDVGQQMPSNLSEPVMVTEHGPRILRSWNHTHLEWTKPVWPVLCDKHDCILFKKCDTEGPEMHAYHWDNFKWNILEDTPVLVNRSELEPERQCQNELGRKLRIT